MPTPLHANASVLTRADSWSVFVMNLAVMAYKGTETDVLNGVEMAWRADATAQARLHFVTAKWLSVTTE